MNLRNLRFRRSPDEAASAWLARRDRGMTPREQDEYLRWLLENKSHPEAMARAEATLRRMLRLSAWQYECSAEPNPDLLARPRQRNRWRWPAAAAAAVAAALVLASWWHPPVGRAAVAPKTYLRVNDHVVLPDGSRAELRDGTRLDVLYREGIRRVRLTGGEAQFYVQKDPSRPFVVEAGGVAVRALGTVFTVQLGREAVAVLVTEGKVRVGATESGPESTPVRAGGVGEPVVVVAGQRALVRLAAVTASPAVAAVSPEEISQALEWREPRLQFNETPLADAVAEFNRRNRHQLVLGDAALGAKRIGGSFRPDNVEGFVRLLTITLGVQTVSHGPEETVLFGRD
ncbi:MAG: FecR family protein [Opitutales bacterium]